MPLPIEQMDQYDTVLYWPWIGTDDTGAPLLNAPVEIKGRWEDADRELLAANGTRIRSNSTLITSQELVDSSIVYRGTEDQFNYEGSGQDVVNLMQVYVAGRIPDIKGQMNEFMYLLVRYGDSLPTVQ